MDITDTLRASMIEARNNIAKMADTLGEMQHRMYVLEKANPSYKDRNNFG